MEQDKDTPIDTPIEADAPIEEKTSFKRKSLEDVLTAETDPPAKTESDKTSDSDEKAEPDKDPDKADAKDADDKAKGEKAADADPDAPPASEKDKSETHQIPVAAHHDERRRRQQAEARNAELEKRLETLERGTRPDEFEDPDGAAEWDKQAEKDAQAKNAQERFMDRVESSEEFMRELHPDDYQEAEDAFIEAAKSDRQLLADFNRHPAPAKFAYHEGKRILAEKEIGENPEAYKAKIKEEVKAELLEELKADQDPPANVPKSLANEPSASTRDTSKTWDGPKPLKEIYG